MIKAVVRGIWTVEVGWRRRVRPPQWQLAGACESCAACCERPSIGVGKALWFLPTLRRAFLAWQRVVNGFELVEADRETRSFAFRCTHFDPETRRCDSYASRPFMCRDYPRVHLDAAWPELFERCGFRPRARDAERQIAELEAAGVGPEKVEELKRKLYLR